MLYTLSSSPFASQALTDILRLATAQDALLLWSDGVLAALVGSEFAEPLAASPVKVYVLQADAQARGIAERLLSQIQVIDYSGWVALTEQHPQQLAY
ncbi:MAG: sulfurtransferase complex subunit TusB [Plesiomonas shigelloides]|uniref:sulfurtransferase complex subunit TusB n=1 Tax=Plesiomonas shigelloides TaxID=703 RepID=UPI0012619351|nr:sulfurtransferase complex subunit TusB [Plesiomonas shigelloides]KAB7660370.1 sulfurtransferase complex subunit TusB [Plesiomonas shigelloides]QIY09201.1 sulfurtransferase complex subunit TusB [Plesiomonas shigelloides]